MRSSWDKHNNKSTSDSGRGRQCQCSQVEARKREQDKQKVTKEVQPGVKVGAGTSVGILVYGYSRTDCRPLYLMTDHDALMMIYSRGSKPSARFERCRGAETAAIYTARRAVNEGAQFS